MNMNTKAEMLAAATVSDPRWAAVLARDPQYDGKFVYSVRTTGVYCRPSCAARVARPENVAFHITTADAEHAGFRPCQRCKPDQPSIFGNTPRSLRSCAICSKPPSKRPVWPNSRGKPS
jgi:AraC family transcriptional regulator of adaptative response/methylated-DNA-[protein]-cysteine methyltransferase